MALADLKARLAAIATAVQTSVATVATERIEKAKVKDAERQAKAEKSRAQKFLLDALPGTNEEKEKRLEEIEQSMAEYQEICKLLDETEIEYGRAGKAAPADRDQLLATAKAVRDEVRSEKERIEADPNIKFFGRHRWLENQTENPDRRVAIEEIDRAIKDGFLREITGECSRATQAAAKAAKEEGRHYEERHPPFFWVRVKPRGNTSQGEQEPDDHFRYISGGVDFYARSVEGARKRLVFFALQAFWTAVSEAKKAAYEADQDVKKHSYLSLAEIAAGQSGQAWAEVTAANPWRPTFFDQEKQTNVPLMKEGRAIVNYGPMVVVSPKSGVLHVMNTVHSGMFHPLRLAGAWEEQDGKLVPVEFRFFAGNNPRTGQPNNFAGLKPVKDTIVRTPSQLGRLRAILCLPDGLQAPVREANGGGASQAPQVGVEPDVPPDIVSDIPRRGYRPDGSKAGEPRSKKHKGRKGTDDEVPEVPKGIHNLADAEKEE